MRRTLTFPAAAVATAVGVLLPAGPAAAQGDLVPGATQVLSIALDRTDWRGEVPDGITVGVTDLVQLENRCLEPEAAAGDTACDDDEGDLAQQLVATVAGGVLDRGECRALGTAARLDLLSAALVPLGIDRDAEDWAAVDCLHVQLTFADRSDNNLAQSDAVTFSLETTAWADVPPTIPPAGDPPPGNAPTGVSPSGDSPADAGSAALPGGTLDTGRTGAGNAAGGAAGGAGGGAAGGAGGGAAGGGTAAGGDASTPGALASGVGEGVVLGQSDASVTIGEGAVQPRSAETSFVAQALAWGSVFVGALVIGWALFLLARRRRRTERVA